MTTRKWFNLAGLDLNDDDAIDRWAADAHAAFLQATGHIGESRDGKNGQAQSPIVQQDCGDGLRVAIPVAPSHERSIESQS